LDQLAGELWHLLDAAHMEPALKNDVAAIDISELRESAFEALELHGLRRRAAAERADPIRLRPRLGPRRGAGSERQNAGSERDEVAAPHPMTSSARASSAGGTVRPSDLAGLRVMTG